MTLEKMKVGLLIGFIGLVFAILALFVPASMIFFALIVALLFIIPILAIASIVVIGASIFSKKKSKSKKEAIVILLDYSLDLSTSERCQDIGRI